ncbi:hypothetical protein DPX16_20045 [Anabarilius grahami]|uniref:Uncharacterized protein n=1 Tax=Anabarilius grahami TaxID=495550 RepID=A0A3N0XQI8_ANAGA|nr:hypothetical protein DPX16_20045 [Anabarilius grahami]
MNITEACASDETDAEKGHPTIGSTKRSTESSCRQYVNELLDLSEEDYCREHNMHLFQCRTGWEDAEKNVAHSIRRVSVLPPVRESRNLRSYSLFKRVQPTDWHQTEVSKAMMPGATDAVTAAERENVNGGTGNVVEVLTNFIPEKNSYRFKGSPSTKHWLSQDSTQLPPTFNITFQNKHELPSSTMAYTTVGRNLKQEELTRPSTRNNTSYRLYSAHKTRDLKRAEAHQLMLIGTKVHMPGTRVHMPT